MLYKIALCMLQGISCRNLKLLMEACGDAEFLFKERKRILEKMPGIRPEVLLLLSNKKILEDAERELLFLEKHSIRPLWYEDSSYPTLLKHCEDAPLILFSKGNVSINTKKCLSIVGTRKATSYGIGMCEALISGLCQRGHHPLIISGLAYGIDICAHRAALKNGLDTVAVLGHSLREIYPSEHRETAKDIISHGALITEFHSLDQGGKSNFVRRNRIIAGISEATLVIESGVKGGSLITAELALSYHREVFCVPGRCTDRMSKGCNQFIRNQKAALVESPEDLEYYLGWSPDSILKDPVQLHFFSESSESERSILALFQEHNTMNVNELSVKSGKTVSQILNLLLEMELKGLVETIPGNQFRACGRVMI
jgi:DNA processing protein